MTLTQQPAWLDEFRSFTPMHALVVVAIVAMTLAFCWIGRRLARRDAAASPEDRPARAERIFRWTAAGIFLATNWFLTLYWMRPGQREWNEALPLHVCDLTAWIAPFVLLTRIRLLHAVLFFMGLTLSPLALAYPVLVYGPAHPVFWVFWLGHWTIYAAAIYDVSVLGYRPNWRDYAIALAFQVGMVALVVVPVNYVLRDQNANYWYLGPHVPATTNPVKYFGPWPLRILTIGITVAALQAALCWVMQRTHLRSPKHARDLRPPDQDSSAQPRPHGSE